MSTQTSFVTPAPPLRAYASTADLAISPPSHHEASDHGARESRRRRTCGPSLGRSASSSSRFAVTFLTVFVVLPLVVVFASAFSKGISALFLRARRAGGACPRSG